VKIDLTELLRNAGNEGEVEEEEKASYPEDGLILTRPAKVKLHLVNTGPTVLMNGTVETEVEAQCARCGTRFRLPLTAKIDEEFSKNPPLPKPKKGRKEAELRENDFVYPIEKDNTLDLAEIVRQNLLLALPIKMLCRPECKGE
jgi:uncharacterized protein